METAVASVSMERQSAWLDSAVNMLWERFENRYGSLWMDRWAGLPMSRVKAEWTEELRGFKADALKHGFDSVKGNKFPPTLPEFVDACRRAPADIPLPLPAPELSVEERMDRARQLEAEASRPSSYDYRGWCKELKRRYLAGEHLLPVQVSMASEAMNEVWIGGECKPRADAA